MVSSRFLLALERDLPCSWESGYELASADINFVGAAVVKWWLDIETANSRG